MDEKDKTRFMFEELARVEDQMEVLELIELKLKQMKVLAEEAVSEDVSAHERMLLQEEMDMMTEELKGLYQEAQREFH